VIGRQATSPFFLYMAFAHMHVPQFCSAEHCNATGAGPFADALAELDATVGSIVASLEAASKTKDTVVFLTGDNGPWEAKCELTGSKGPFRGAWQATHGGGGSSGKFTLFEGGACFVFVWRNAFHCFSAHRRTLLKGFAIQLLLLCAFLVLYLNL